MSVCSYIKFSIPRKTSAVNTQCKKQGRVSSALSRVILPPVFHVPGLNDRKLWVRSFPGNLFLFLFLHIFHPGIVCAGKCKEYAAVSFPALQGQMTVIKLRYIMQKEAILCHRFSKRNVISSILCSLSMQSSRLHD